MDDIRKSAKMEISTFITIVALLILAFVLVMFDSKTLWGTKSSFEALGPSKCSDENPKSIEYYNTLTTYGKRERSAGVANELYDPEYALKQFKIYLACKKDKKVTDADEASYDQKIMSETKAVYVNAAEDVCKEIAKAVSGTKQEQKDLKDKYADIVDDYDEVFGGGSTSLKKC